MRADQLLDRHQVLCNEIPQVHWPDLLNSLDTEPVAQRDELWGQACQLWVDRLTEVLQPDTRQWASRHFTILSAAEESEAAHLATFFDQAVDGDCTLLPGVAPPEHGLLVLVEQQDRYYDYIDFAYPDDGEYGGSSGIFLDQPVPQLVFPRTDIGHSKTVAAHEITHYCVSRLPLPTWLNEGLACTLEAVLAGQPGLQFGAVELIELRETWHVDNIQEFHSGTGICNPELSNQSYLLATMAVKALTHDTERFVEFLHAASFEDAGQAAMQKVFGRGIEGLLQQFLGPGDWSPRPETW